MQCSVSVGPRATTLAQHQTGVDTGHIQLNTTYLCSICTTPAQHLRHWPTQELYIESSWSNIALMLCRCFAFTGIDLPPQLTRDIDTMTV